MSSFAALRKKVKRRRKKKISLMMKVIFMFFSIYIYMITMIGVYSIYPFFVQFASNIAK
jgi:polyferredoxin